MSSVGRGFLVLLVLAAVSAGDAFSQQKTRDVSGQLGQNADVVGLIAGSAGSASMRMATDVAAVLDDDDLRILPISGKSAVQTVTDLLYLKGIDAAVLPSDVLAHVEARRIHTDALERIHYVAKLYGEEIHLIARRAVAGPKDLMGKKVNLGPEHGASAISGEAVFAALDIRIEPTRYELWEALAKLKAGEIDALVHVAPKPVELLTSVSPDSGLRLVPLSLGAESEQRYPAALLTAADYPGLIEPNGEVATASVSQVLAVFNWERSGTRHDRVRRFVDRFLDSFDKFGEQPLDRRWRDVNLAVEVAGWERDDRTNAWLAKTRADTSKKTGHEAEALRSAFKRFLDASGEAAALSQDDQTELFQRFMQWKQAGGQ